MTPTAAQHSNARDELRQGRPQQHGLPLREWIEGIRVRVVRMEWDVGADSRRLQRHAAIPELRVGRLHMILTVVTAERRDDAQGCGGTMANQS